MSDSLKTTRNIAIIVAIAAAVYFLPGGGRSANTFESVLWVAFGVGIGYDDECTSLKISYTNTVSDPIAATPSYHDQTILVQLTLRTLGEIKAASDVSSLLGGAPPP